MKSFSVGKTSLSLDEDTYHFVVDHSTMGEAQPDWGDEVRFEAQLNSELS